MGTESAASPSLHTGGSKHELSDIYCRSVKSNDVYSKSHIRCSLAGIMHMIKTCKAKCNYDVQKVVTWSQQLVWVLMTQYVYLCDLHH